MALLACLWLRTLGSGPSLSTQLDSSGSSQPSLFSPKHTAALRHLQLESPSPLTLRVAPRSLPDSSPDLNLLLAHLRAIPLIFPLWKPEIQELAVTPYVLSSLNLIQFQVLSIASPLGHGLDLIFLWNYFGVLSISSPHQLPAGSLSLKKYILSNKGLIC